MTHHVAVDAFDLSKADPLIVPPYLEVLHEDNPAFTHERQRLSPGPASCVSHCLLLVLVLHTHSDAMSWCGPLQVMVA